ncbi:MAG: hypothetical protein AAF585_03775, partial [Verrucomicrobiota bacterium]
MKAQVLQAASQAGAANHAQLEELVSNAFANDTSVVDEVLDSHLVDESGFLKELSAELGLNWHTHVRPDSADTPQLKKACPEKIGLKHRFVPLRFVDDDGENGNGDRKLELVTYDPISLQPLQAARKGIPYSIRWSLASRRLVLEALQEFYGVGADIFAAILEGRDVDPNATEAQEEVNVLDEDDQPRDEELVVVA